MTMLVVTVFLVLLAAGCGSGDDSDSATSSDAKVSNAKLIERCLGKQPDATKADCTEWVEDGQIGDDGVHQGHEDMDMDT